MHWAVLLVGSVGDTVMEEKAKKKTETTPVSREIQKEGGAKRTRGRM